MKTVLIFSNTVTVIVVLLSVFVDYEWQKVVLNPISGENITYGEMYGPLSYFKPILLYGAVVVVVVNFVVGCFVVARLKNT